jgi:hypothetical protein
MIDLTDLSAMQSHARALVAHPPLAHVSLSVEQAREVAVSLTSAAGSWDEYCRQPCAPLLPSGLEAYLAAITRTQRRLAALALTPMLTRGERSILAIRYLIGARWLSKRLCEVQRWHFFCRNQCERRCALWARGWDLRNVNAQPLITNVTNSVVNVLGNPATNPFAPGGEYIGGTLYNWTH